MQAQRRPEWVCVHCHTFPHTLKALFLHPLFKMLPGDCWLCPAFVTGQIPLVMSKLLLGRTSGCFYRSELLNEQDEQPFWPGAGWCYVVCSITRSPTTQLHLEASLHTCCTLGVSGVLCGLDGGICSKPLMCLEINTPKMELSVSVKCDIRWHLRQS